MHVYHKVLALLIVEPMLLELIFPVHAASQLISFSKNVDFQTPPVTISLHASVTASTSPPWANLAFIPIYPSSVEENDWGDLNMDVQSNEGRISITYSGQTFSQDFPPLSSLQIPLSSGLDLKIEASVHALGAVIGPHGEHYMGGGGDWKSPGKLTVLRVNSRFYNVNPIKVEFEFTYSVSVSLAAAGQSILEKSLITIPSETTLTEVINMRSPLSLLAVPILFPLGIGVVVALLFRNRKGVLLKVIRAETWALVLIGILTFIHGVMRVWKSKVPYSGYPENYLAAEWFGIAFILLIIAEIAHWYGKVMRERSLTEASGAFK